MVTFYALACALLILTVVFCLIWGATNELSWFKILVLFGYAQALNAGYLTGLVVRRGGRRDGTSQGAPLSPHEISPEPN
jgi:hypothetical protein